MLFFKYKPEYREKMLLEFIEVNDDISQPDIARYVGFSTAMVNTYINEAEKEGHLKRVYKSRKVVEYNITPKGIKRKNFLQITYMKDLMNLYLEGKKTMAYFIDSIIEKGFKEVVFYGAGEVAEIMLDIIQITKMDINVECIIDDDREKQNTKFRGINVCPLSALNQYKHDGIIITSYTYEEAIIDKLNKIDYPSDKIIKYFEV